MPHGRGIYLVAGSNGYIFMLAGVAGADPGFLKRGVHLRSTSKKGGPGGGPILGPMFKSLHSGPKRADPPMGCFTNFTCRSVQLFWSVLVCCVCIRAHPVSFYYRIII